MCERADVRTALLVETLALEVEGIVLLLREEYLPIGRVIPDVTVEGSRDFLGIAYNHAPRIVIQLTPEVVVIHPLVTVEEEHCAIPV